MSDKPIPGWTQDAKALLDDSAAGLDAATLSRLNRARQAALAQRAPPRRWMLPAGLASACLMLLAVSVWHGRVQDANGFTQIAKNSAPGDIDLVSSDDGPEFYQDLEFYAWLEAQDPDLGS